MRDPDGTLSSERTQVTRVLKNLSTAREFLQTRAARKLVEDGFLVDFSFISQDEVISPKLKFVSYPHEWCDSQFVDAAHFTLELSQRVLPEGVELKDASAWNVLFSGCQPVFCDHLSFAQIAVKQWWAMGQFARHFIFPLLLASKRRFFAHNAFLLSRDGFEPHVTRDLLGSAWLFSRSAPLLLHHRNRLQTNLTKLRSGQSSFHEFLYKYCKWCVPQRSHHPTSIWAGYVNDRAHYTPAEESLKIGTIRRWLERLKPEWVLDLGCNTGEYTALAEQVGASVIAVDADHDAVDRLYCSFKDSANVYPVIADFGNLVGGAGWLGQEAIPLPSRLVNAVDVVLCLALTHHLICSQGIPFPAITAMLASFAKGYVAIELIAHDDPMVELLMKERNRRNDYPLIRAQKEALSQLFHFKDSQVITSGRELILMERLNSARSPAA